MAKNKKTKLVIAGYFGAGNIGDEAILYSVVNSLHQEFEISVMTVGDSRFPEFSQEIQYNELPNMRNIVKIKNFLYAVMRCDCFLLGGGGFLASMLQSSSIYYWMALVFVAKFFRKRVIIFGAGCGPFKDGPGRFFLRHMFENIDFIFVRDSTSEHNLRDLGVKKPIQIISDLAFLLEPDSFASSPHVADLLIGHPHPYVLFVLPRRFHIASIWSPAKYSEKYGKYVETLTNLADFVSRTLRGTPIFFPFCKEDILLYHQILDKMDFNEQSIIIDNLDTQNIDFGLVFSYFRLADLVIAGRYHSFIFSVLTKTPAIPIIYHPKYYDVVSRADLLDVSVEIGDGIEWPNTDLNQIKLEEAIKLVQSDKQNYNTKLRQFEADMKSLAALGITSLKTLLK